MRPMDDSKPNSSRPEPSAPGAEGDLYVVATVHLDTQWRWTIQRTIREYLPDTFEGNFALFEKYPHYVLSWEGAFRYMLIREYYPEAWRKLREYAAAGRWTVAGNMLESIDVNLVSPESLIRQFLYGSRFFESELDSHACDVFLPDCFGFGYSFPTIAAHCGLTGFSSQKLIKWIHPAEPPFEVGVWEGPDGASLLTVLRPDGYGDGLDEDLSRSERWRDRIRALGEATGVRAGYKYFGIGDRGGAPDENSLKLLEQSLERPGPIRIVHGRSDLFFRELDQHRDRLPRHKGELLLPEHGPGCYTSMASMKRWNRRNEQLADAAERAACAAAWTTGAGYPAKALRESWLRFLWHQMHDDLTGTSIPQAYAFSWNDQAIAENRFESVLTDSVGALTTRLDTETQGVALVVFNPLSIDREDLVEAEIEIDAAGANAARVFDPEGVEVPSQVTLEHASSSKGAPQRFRVTFLAAVPSLGCAVFDVRAAEKPCDLPTRLAAGYRGLENQRYRIELHSTGDIARIHDKALGVELLDEPLELQLMPDTSSKFPAWEMHYRDVMADPHPVSRLLGSRVVETGPARVAVEIRRAARGSTLTQRIALAAGDAGDRLEIDNRLEWRTWGRMLKASFPIGDRDSEATYDLGLGVIQRGINRPESYEVPAQQWADLSSPTSGRGVSIINDCKYGWDRPSAETLRLTLVRSPRSLRGHAHQMTQDWALHRFTYALYSHPGDWRQGTVWQAARLNQPLRAFQVESVRRDRPRRLSFASVGSAEVAIRALKRSEDGGDWIVRLQELAGHAQSDVRVTLTGALESAHETNGVEHERSAAATTAGELVTDLGPFEPKTFAVRLDPTSGRSPSPVSKRVRLPFDTRATSADGHGDGDLDGHGHSFPAELFPATLTDGGIEFALGPVDAANCLTCRGQQLPLPEGDWRRVYLLAASIDGDVDTAIRVEGQVTPLRISSYRGPIGQASHRRALGRVHYGPIRPAFARPDRIAWVATHLHDREGANLPYEFGYLFRYRVELPAGLASTLSVLELPDEPRVQLFAVTLGRNLRVPARRPQPHPF